MIRHFLSGGAPSAVDIARGRVLSSKTPDALHEVLSSDVTIEPWLSAFDGALGDLESKTGSSPATTRRPMMPVLVRIPTPLRAMTKGAAEVPATADTVEDLIADLERQFPGFRDRLVEEGGEIRRFINIYVNQEDIRFLQGAKTTLKEGDEVTIVPAIAGGR
jgi:molybdopterin synthase sulfur carrier subunit